jgi:hypothetical protein
MHLQQTKRESRRTGGPQYYFHDLTEEVAQYLRAKKGVPVALVTPYGATPSKFFAVSGEAKLRSDGSVTSGRVGHDRIQQAGAPESIGEAIRRWYKLQPGDFERIDLDVQIIDGKFYVSPLNCKYAGRPRPVAIQKPEHPLSFNDRFRSQLWRRQLDWVRKERPAFWSWSLKEICRVAAAHADRPKPPNVQEQDLLRASGPLHTLGVELGPYVGRGFDCEGCFQFLNFESYTVPVEIKKRSSGFKYQQKRYSQTQLSRVVVLCSEHDMLNVPANVDVIELKELCQFLVEAR